MNRRPERDWNADVVGVRCPACLGTSYREFVVGWLDWRTPAVSDAPCPTCDGRGEHECPVAYVAGAVANAPTCAMGLISNGVLRLYGDTLLFSDAETWPWETPRAARSEAA